MRLTATRENLHAEGPTFCGGEVAPRQGGRRTSVWRSGSVEAEEDHSEICFESFGRILLELGLDVDDEGGADRREQINLGLW